jgi:4-alpha-glucanotransferase
MKKVLGDKPVIAEDLGFMTDTVIELVEHTGFPGMKVLQFAFYENSDSAYLAQNHVKNSVVYTGTHDNQTTLGWYQTLTKKDRDFLEEYTGITSWKNVCSVMIRFAMMSVCDTCVVPMQDYLELNDSARINEPGSLGNNWKWRMKKDVTEQYKELSKRIYKLTKMYGRL